MLTEADMVVLVGMKEKPGFCCPYMTSSPSHHRCTMAATSVARPGFSRSWLAQAHGPRYPPPPPPPFRPFGATGPVQSTLPALR